MKASDLPRNQLIDVANGFGIHDWHSYDDLLEQVERWPAGPDRTVQPPRTVRQRAAGALAVALVAGWLGVTGVFVGAMKVVNRIEGKR